VRTDQIGAGSALVDEDEAFPGDPGDRLRPGTTLLQDRGLVLLGGAQGLLFF
jgi:hypothetical protein